jgi:hypothetical protein
MKKHDRVARDASASEWVFNSWEAKGRTADLRTKPEIHLRATFSSVMPWRVGGLAKAAHNSSAHFVKSRCRMQ